MSANHQETLKVGGTGIIASVFTWFIGAFKWYAGHLQTITDVLAHIAQIGGIAVIILTIRNLLINKKKKQKELD